MDVVDTAKEDRLIKAGLLRKEVIAMDTTVKDEDLEIEDGNKERRLAKIRRIE